MFRASATASSRTAAARLAGAYTFVLIPLVTVLLSAWIDDEPIGAGLVLGGLLVLAGVYVGALRPAAAPPPRTKVEGRSAEY